MLCLGVCGSCNQIVSRENEFEQQEIFVTFKVACNDDLSSGIVYVHNKASLIIELYSVSRLYAINRATMNRDIFIFPVPALLESVCL